MYDEAVKTADEPIKIFSDIDICHKKLEQLERRLRPILTSLPENKDLSKPQQTDLDGAIINLQDRISSLLQRVRL